MDSGITVTGIGRATAPADLLRVHLGIGCAADDVAAAVDAVGGRTKAVLDALRRHGVGDDDLWSTAVTVFPDYGPEPTRAHGYRAGHSITVTSRDLDGFGRLLDVAVDAAGNDLTVEHVGFEVEDTSALVVRARQQAFDDARAKAVELAGLAGRELGELVALEEHTGHGHAVSLAMAPGPGRKVAAELGLEPGEQTVQIALTIHWSIT